MEVSAVLKKVGIKPDEPVFLITAEEALENIVEAIGEYCPHLRLEKMKKNEIQALLESYARCVIDYHPEDNHQERAALIENFKMLKRYGLTEDDYDSLDFC